MIRRLVLGGILLLVAVSMGVTGTAGELRANVSPERINKDAEARIRVTIGGEVNKPGPLDLPGVVSLGEAIKKAGGPAAGAATGRVQLYRKGKVYAFDLDGPKQWQMPLADGDKIEIPRKHG